MNIVKGVDLIANTNEERLPGFSGEFPYIASRAELSSYPVNFSPWHWHNVAELFYIEEGSVEYETPKEKVRFEKGQCGLIMPSVLHTTTWNSDDNVVELIHLFSPTLLFGNADGRMARKYIYPLTKRLGRSVYKIATDPESSSDSEKEIIDLIKDAFTLDENSFDFEFTLREKLCRVWIYCLGNTSVEVQNAEDPEDNGVLKEMMSFIKENCCKDISVENIANSGNVSLRTCYRTFREVLHMTPNDYLISLRLQKACGLLSESDLSVTEVAMECGFSSVGYFGKTFRKALGCSPTEFKKMA